MAVAAYTPDSLASIKRSLADIAAGRVFALTTDDLERGRCRTAQKR